MIHRCETCSFWARQPNNPDGSIPTWGTCDTWGSHEVGEKASHYKCGAFESVGRILTIEPVATQSHFGCVMHPMNKAIA